MRLSAPLTGAILKNKDFLTSAKAVLSHLKDGMTLESLFEKSGLEIEPFSRRVYFALLAGAVNMPQDSPDKERQLKKISDQADLLLSQQHESLFDILQLPYRASVKDIRAKYKSLVSALHPDHLPPKASEKIKKKCGAAMGLVNEAYSALFDEKKRAAYIQEREEEIRERIASGYDEGVKFLKMKSYSEALKAFQSIKESEGAPKKTSLYSIWAEIKSRPHDMKNPQKAALMRQQINHCPLELKISPLFWFVQGIFYFHSGQHKKAVFFLSKTLEADRGFREARFELFQVRKELQKMSERNQESLLQKFFGFKKSG